VLFLVWRLKCLLWANRSLLLLAARALVGLLRRSIVVGLIRRRMLDNHRGLMLVVLSLFLGLFVLARLDDGTGFQIVSDHFE